MKFTKLVKADNTISLDDDGTLFHGIVKDQKYVVDMAKHLQNFIEDCNKTLGFITNLEDNLDTDDKYWYDEDTKDWYYDIRNAKLQAIDLLKMLRKNYFNVV